MDNSRRWYIVIAFSDALRKELILLMYCYNIWLYIE